MNMLIAQMTTTFEKIREKLAKNYMFLTALLTVSAINETHVPVPLTVLGFPYHLLSGLLKLCLGQLYQRLKGESVEHGSPATAEDVKKQVQSKELHLRKMLLLHLEKTVGEESADDGEQWKSRQARDLGNVRSEIKQFFPKLEELLAASHNKGKQ